MRRRENHRRGVTRPGGLQPANGAQAPAIPGDEAREAPLRLRGDQIVANRHREGEEVCGHHGADGVRARIGGDRPAAAVAQKARQRIMGAGHQRRAENVAIGRAFGGSRGAVKGDHRWRVCGGLELRGASVGDGLSPPL